MPWTIGYTCVIHHVHSQGKAFSFFHSFKLLNENSKCTSILHIILSACKFINKISPNKVLFSPKYSTTFFNFHKSEVLVQLIFVVLKWRCIWYFFIFIVIFIFTGISLHLMIYWQFWWHFSPLKYNERRLIFLNLLLLQSGIYFYNNWNVHYCPNKLLIIFRNILLPLRT